MFREYEYIELFLIENIFPSMQKYNATICDVSLVINLLMKFLKAFCCFARICWLNISLINDPELYVKLPIDLILNNDASK